MKQTAGRDVLGEFAPMFAHLNDDVLFGEVWDQEAISTKTKCIVTMTALISQGIADSSLRHHMENARKNGVTREEAAAIITHATMYSGWPKGWAAFRLAKEVWTDDEEPAGEKGVRIAEPSGLSKEFPKGVPNDAYAQYFVGNSWVAPLGDPQLGATNVTFEPGCRNNWHIHHKAARCLSASPAAVGTRSGVSPRRNSGPVTS